MPDILPRSTWIAVPSGAREVQQLQEEIYIHYPAAGADVGLESLDEIAGRLEGWFFTHTQIRGWQDIAYNWAVDQVGRIWELRGKRQSGANGGEISNERGLAILCIVGDTEQPTSALVDSVSDLIVYIREWQITAGRILGHQESPDLGPGDTECPGVPLMSLIRQGAFGESYEPGEVPGVPIPPVEEPDDPDDPTDPPPTIGLTVDGRFGAATVRVLQRRLGVTVDGRAGSGTWRALQSFLGTPVDGVVSNQSYRAEELGNGITQGWEFTGRGSSGSTMVRALQEYVGVGVDGIWFEGTTRAIQRRLNNDSSAFTTSG